MPHRIGDDENIELENYHKGNQGSGSSSSSSASENSEDECLPEIEVETMDHNNMISES